MKFFAIFLALFVAVAYFGACSAMSEPVCMYTNSKGENIFLKYFRGINKGQSYSEVLPNGNCLQVTCQEDYTLKPERCPVD